MSEIINLLTNSILFLFDKDNNESLGTSFFLGYQLTNNPSEFIPLIVTAKHVIGEKSAVIGRINNKSGSPIQIEYDIQALKQNGDYWEHSDKGVDIVVFRSLHFAQAEYAFIPISWLIKKDEIVSEDIKPTDHIIFPCLLPNFIGFNKNYPFIRNGTIALIPDEKVPLRQKIHGTEIISQQEVILIDAISIGGASGSPVFLWPDIYLKNNSFITGGNVRLLGIMHGYYPVNIPVHTIQTQSKIICSQENTGIAILFPSWKLLEILDSSEFKSKMHIIEENQINKHKIQ